MGGGGETKASTKIMVGRVGKGEGGGGGGGEERGLYFVLLSSGIRASGRLCSEFRTVLRRVSSRMKKRG